MPSKEQKPEIYYSNLQNFIFMLNCLRLINMSQYSYLCSMNILYIDNIDKISEEYNKILENILPPINELFTIDIYINSKRYNIMLTKGILIFYNNTTYPYNNNINKAIQIINTLLYSTEEPNVAYLYLEIKKILGYNNNYYLDFIDHFIKNYYENDKPELVKIIPTINEYSLARDLFNKKYNTNI